MKSLFKTHEEQTQLCSLLLPTATVVPLVLSTLLPCGTIYLAAADPGALGASHNTTCNTTLTTVSCTFDEDPFLLRKSL